MPSVAGLPHHQSYCRPAVVAAAVVVVQPPHLRAPAVVAAVVVAQPPHLRAPAVVVAVVTGAPLWARHLPYQLGVAAVPSLMQPSLMPPSCPLEVMPPSCPLEVMAAVVHQPYQLGVAVPSLVPPKLMPSSCPLQVMVAEDDKCKQMVEEREGAQVEMSHLQLQLMTCLHHCKSTRNQLLTCQPTYCLSF